MVERHLTGAHYGLGDWIMQRTTAIVMIVYTVAMIGFLLYLPSSAEGSFIAWQVFFKQTWVQIFTQITFIAFALHVWVGIRDLWMDYVKPAYIRLFLHAVTILWLFGCLVYSTKVIWGL